MIFTVGMKSVSSLVPALLVIAAFRIDAQGLATEKGYRPSTISFPGRRIRH
jgi:hypothetical protein